MSGRQGLTIGSRGSDLALWQAGFVRGLLRDRFPSLEFPIQIIRTAGDRIQDRPLYRVEDKGFFTKEIEEALLDRRVDIAVHSLKDLPTVSRPELTIAAIPEREDPRDVWLASGGITLRQAPPSARVGTSSLRRQAQLRAVRPDLELHDLRGNVPTRVQRLKDGLYDAVVLARAGLYRLGLLPPDAEALPFDIMLPAPGQGALGIQVRSDDAEAVSRVERLDHFPTRLCVTAERAFLNRLRGGCLVPVGAHAEPAAGRLRLDGMVADLTGEPLDRGSEERALDPSAMSPSAMMDAMMETPDRPTAGHALEQAAALGVALADRLLSEGAAAVLDRVREFLRGSSGDPRGIEGIEP